MNLERTQRPQPPAFVPDQLIVSYRQSADLPSVAQLNQQHNAHMVKKLGTSGQLSNTTLIQLPPNSNVRAMEAVYEASPNVVFAEPNYILTKQMTPNDPYFNGTNPLAGYQWNLERIKMREAWDKFSGITIGLNTVKVAVIDTGVAFETYGAFTKAPELSQVNFVNPKQFVSYSWSTDCQTPTQLTTPINDIHPNDRDGHGTHVTSTIAQAMNNGAHATGIASGVSIIPIKAADDLCGIFIVADVVSAINHAITSQAQVINLSLGMTSPSTAMEQAINNALSSGVTVIAATGNDASRTSSFGIIYPAAYTGVIAVGASRFDNMRADYSDFEAGKVTLLAPGGQWVNDLHTFFLDANNDTLPDSIVAQSIYPQSPNQFTSIKNAVQYHFGAYRCIVSVTCSDGSPGCYVLDPECGTMVGTSMATPHVTAVVALMKSKNPSLSPAQIKSILETTAQKSVIPGYNPTEHGAGLLDANAAITQAMAAASKPGDYDADNDVDFLDFRQVKNAFTSLFDFSRHIGYMWQ